MALMRGSLELLISLEFQWIFYTRDVFRHGREAGQETGKTGRRDNRHEEISNDF